MRDLPEKMKHLPKDKRGFPVPYIVLRDDAGNYHFQINDSRIVESCLKWKLCSICGKALHSDMWLIGGKLSAFHPNGAFNDPPIHYECGKFALEVCPYLACSGEWKNTDKGKIVSRVSSENGIVFLDPTAIPGKPEYFVFLKLSTFKYHFGDEGQVYVVPKKPYLEVEFWQGGNKIENLLDIYKTR